MHLKEPSFVVIQFPYATLEMGKEVSSRQVTDIHQTLSNDYQFTVTFIIICNRYIIKHNIKGVFDSIPWNSILWRKYMENKNLPSPLENEFHGKEF